MTDLPSATQASFSNSFLQNLCTRYTVTSTKNKKKKPKKSFISDEIIYETGEHELDKLEKLLGKSKRKRRRVEEEPDDGIPLEELGEEIPLPKKRKTDQEKIEKFARSFFEKKADESSSNSMKNQETYTLPPKRSLSFAEMISNIEQMANRYEKDPLFRMQVKSAYRSKKH